MAAGGVALRLGATTLRALQFLAAAVVLGIFSYFLAVLSHNNVNIARRWQAVEGISGAACLYAIFGVILTCFLGGNIFFGYLAVLLDVLFMGAFIAVAIITRHGANSCRGYVDTPLGNGSSSTNLDGFPSLHYACRLNTVTFAISIILVFFFFISAAVQLLLVRHHKKEKRYGPSPANNYTSGRGKFWQRKQKVHNTHDAEVATALPGTTTHNAVRPSGETLTGSTAPYTTAEPKYGQPGYGQATNY